MEAGSIIRRLKSLTEDSDKELLSLAFGEIKFDPPRSILLGAVKAFKQGKHGYTSTEGIPELRAGIARYLERQFGALVNPKREILITSGGTEAIFLAASALLKEGGAVLLPDPGWMTYPLLMKQVGAPIRYYSVKQNGKFANSAGEIFRNLDAGVKLVVINSPANPSGQLISKDDLVAILEETRRRNIWLLSDEVYHNITYGGEHFSILQVGDLANVILVNSFSKAFAITGWRIGYAVARPEIISRMNLIKQGISICTNSIAQWAVCHALPTISEFVKKLRSFCEDNMVNILERLNSIPLVSCHQPEGAIFAFPDISRLESSSLTFCEKLIKEGVVATPGAAFGSRGEGHVRLTFALPPAYLNKALDVFDRFCRNYKS